MRAPVRGRCDRIGIFRGEKSATWRGHIALDIIKNIPRDRFKYRFTRNLKSLQICDRQLRLVIKHFFEMRNVPVTVDRVTMKPTAEMIVNSTGCHFAQGKQAHPQRLFRFRIGTIAGINTEQEVKRHRTRKFRRAPNPP